MPTGTNLCQTAKKSKKNFTMKLNPEKKKIRRPFLSLRGTVELIQTIYNLENSSKERDTQPTKG